MTSRIMMHAFRRSCQSGSKCLRMASTSSQTPNKLTGKVAIVTASTEGIGYAIARRLGRDGAKVFISSRKQDNVDKAVESLSAENITVAGMVCHVGKPDDRKKLIEEAISKFGGLDILVSNAAANPVFGNIFDVTNETAWDKIFDTNVKATFFLCKEALPHLEKNKGNIVLVSSIGGLVPFPYLGAYSVSKTALIGLTKAMVPQCSDMSIRVNCIAPGVIQTRFSEALWKDDAAHQEALKSIPANRIGTPEDCADVVSFLASDDAKYVTGETIAITGGMQSRL